MRKNPLKPEFEVIVKPTVKLGGEKIYGYADLNEEKMVVGKKPGDLLNTIIHEKLHLNYPNMSHDKVYENASRIEQTMTLPEMAQELLDVHDRSLNPPHKREIVYTESSNIISNNIK